MCWKVAWVVTDRINGACGMERKETAEAARCWGECIKWKRNEMQGFGVRNERSSRNGMGLNECTDRKHMDKTTRNVFIYCTTTGRWGKWGNARSAGQLTSCWKELDICPHILKTFCAFSLLKKCKWFSGLYFRVGEAWTMHRLGVITFCSAFRRLMGLTRRRNKKQTTSPQRGKGLGENGMNEACEMEMSISWSRGVLKCMIGMKVKWSIRGQRKERPQLLERNGAKMEIIYCKHMDNQTRNVFYFLQPLMGGGEILRSSGSEAGQKRWSMCGYYI